MDDQNQKIAVLFGGGGFIGSYLALELLDSKKITKVILVDINKPKLDFYPKRLASLLENGSIEFISMDVRMPINSELLPDRVDLVINLAAVHREPGHKSFEYYATNLPGAENICDWSEQINCNYLVFTSSISVYGASENEKEQSTKSEQTTPNPNSPYGISKLAAERIHQRWLAKSGDRKLLIVRPGVIFGSGEQGNVTRMVRAIIRGYFIFTGNQQTRKAGGYVKELCRSIVWMIEKQQSSNTKYMLYNFSMDPAPTVLEFAEQISKVSKKARKPINLPFKLLLFGSYFTDILSRLLGRNSNINPTRVRKLLRSNYIEAKQLQASGYQYRYSLHAAMEDWKTQTPGDWH